MKRKRNSNWDECIELLSGDATPELLSEGALRMILRTTHAKRGGVFTFEDGHPSLGPSSGIDQVGIDLVHDQWARNGEKLTAGEILHAAVERPAQRRASYALIPVLVDGGRIVALVYVDSEDDRTFQVNNVLPTIQKVCGLIRKANHMSLTGKLGPITASSWETYVEETPVEDFERQKLLLLLQKNEWNIARVARLMGVTRRSIYLRLERYGIPRERVLKTPYRKLTLSPQSG